MCLRILSLETPDTATFITLYDLLSQPGHVHCAHCVYVDARGDTKKESA